nr:PREDICTED: coiled-coil domain-containing protein 12 [Struthio camelus australis]
MRADTCPGHPCGENAGLICRISSRPGNRQCRRGFRGCWVQSHETKGPAPIPGFGHENKDGGEREKKQFREDEEEEAARHKELKLRNYEPEDEELKKRKVPQAKPASVEDKVKDQLEAAKPEPIIDEVDLANLAPRKPDWDLKRDVAKKLEKLEKRTQRAIAELIRERLKGQEEELASAVGSAKQDGSDSD